MPKDPEKKEITTKILEFLQKYSKQLIIAGTILTVAIIIISIYLYHRNSVIEGLKTKVEMGLMYYIKASTEINKNPQKAQEMFNRAYTYLKDVADKDLKADPVSEASIYVGKISLGVQGDPNIAEKYFSKAVKQSNSPYLKKLGYIGMAEVTLYLDKIAEATTYLSNALKTGEDYGLNDYILISIARILEQQGKISEAEKVYTEITNKNPFSPWRIYVEKKAILKEIKEVGKL